jgi:hypothetical protein
MLDAPPHLRKKEHFAQMNSDEKEDERQAHARSACNENICFICVICGRLFPPYSPTIATTGIWIFKSQNSIRFSLTGFG